MVAAGIVALIAFAVIALGLLLTDSADDSRLEENNLSVPIEELDEAEIKENPDDDDSMIEKSGPYQ